MKEVLDGREETRCPGDIEFRDADAVSAAMATQVRLGSTGNDFTVIVLEVGSGHPEWPENPFLGELAQALTGYPLHDQRHQGKTGVAVEVPFARWEVQFALPAYQIEHIIIGNQVFLAPTGEGEQRPLVTQAAGVLHQVAEGDGGSEIGNLRQPGAEIGVDIEFAFVGEEGDRNTGKLLGDRGDVEDRIRDDGDAVFQVRHAVPTGIGDLAILVDAESNTGRIGAIPFREDRIDTGGNFRRELVGNELLRECQGLCCHAGEPPDSVGKDRCDISITNCAFPIHKTGNAELALPDVM
jgi:hypothetical protein